MEAQLFAQSASIDKLLSMMRSLDTQKENLAENEELLVRFVGFVRGGGMLMERWEQELYQQSMALRPKVVKLIEKYNQKQSESSPSRSRRR